MSRYFSKPQEKAPIVSAWWETQMPPLNHPTATEPAPVDTGLLDADGRKIYRLPDQIGFIRFGRG